MRAGTPRHLPAPDPADGEATVRSHTPSRRAPPHRASPTPAPAPSRTPRRLAQGNAPAATGPNNGYLPPVMNERDHMVEDRAGASVFEPDTMLPSQYFE